MDIKLVTDGEKWAIKKTVKRISCIRIERAWRRDKQVERITYSAQLYSLVVNPYGPWLEAETMGPLGMETCWMERADAEKIFGRLKCMEPSLPRPEPMEIVWR